MMKKYWVDYLRVVAILAVITIHVTEYYFMKFDKIGQIDWWLSNILISASRFSVPLFIMISGAVLIGRSSRVGDFYKKRAIRLLPPIIFWNIFYIGFSLYNGMDLSALIWILKIGFFAQGTTAEHLWFLSMFSCLTLFVPFINKFLTGEKPSFNDLKKLFYVIFFFFFLNSISIIFDDIFNIKIEWYKSFPWYIAYFIGGYYIDEYGMNFSMSNSTILLTITSLTIIGAIINYYFVISLGLSKCHIVFSNTGLLVFVLTVLIFLFAKINSHIFKESRIINKVAEASFGVYLIHPVFIHFLRDWLPAYNSNALFYIPLTILLTTFSSLFLIIFLRRFSFMKIFC